MRERIIRPYEEKDLDAVLMAWESASSVAHPFLSQEFLDQERLNMPKLYLPQAETWEVSRILALFPHPNPLPREREPAPLSRFGRGAGGEGLYRYELWR